MALVLKDRVRETTTTAGTGTVTLAGAVTGFQSFAIIGNGNTTYYCISGQGTNEWEVGIGTYTSSGTTLARTTVLANSAATQPSALSFSAGTKDVFVTYPAEKSVNLDASDNVSALGTVASGTWNGTTIGVSYGGTGLTSFTANGVVYASGAGTLATGTGLAFDGTKLTLGGGTVAPSTPATFNVGAANGATNSFGTAYLYTTDTAAADKGAQLCLGGSYSGTSNAPFAAIAGRFTSGISGYMALSTLNAGTLTEAARIDSSGNVGIGAASGGNKLEVTCAVNAGFKVSDGTYTGVYTPSGLGGMALFVTTNHGLFFGTNNTTRGSIDTNGNIIWGNANTASTTIGGQPTRGIGLDGVNTGSGGNSFYINMNSTGSSGNQFFENYSSNGTSRGYIYYDSGAGVLKFTGQASGTYSDARLKDIVGPSDYGLDTIQQINVYRFNWKRSGNQDVGVVAQELEAVIPEAVQRGKEGDIDPHDYAGDDPWRVDYNKLVPVLIKAVQELTARVAALEGA